MKRFAPDGSRRREALLRFGPLVAMAAALAVLAWLLHRHRFGPQDRADAWILLIVTVAWAYVIVRMVATRKRWSVLGLAMLVAILAEVLLFGRASVNTLFAERPVSMTFLDVVRACFVLGGPLAFVALLWTDVCALRRWRKRRRS